MEQYIQAKDTIEQGIAALSDEAEPEGLAEAYFLLGWLYGVPLTDLENASTHFTRAIELDPEFAAAYINRANAYAEQGNLTAALADYDRAIELDPEVAAAYINRGVAYAEQGDLTAALADFDRALRHEPENVWTLTLRGETHRQMQNTDAALADLPSPAAVASTEAPSQASL